MMTHDEICAVIKAHKQKKLLQTFDMEQWIESGFSGGNGELFDLIEALAHGFKYRPTPKLRPWKPEEVPLGAWYLHESGGSPLYADRLYPSGINFAGRDVLFSHDQLLKQFRYSTDGGKTWLPCGVEESE